MLKHLHIENYTLIQELDLSFSDGLTVITGETGAGKSIILGALSLLLGNRADMQTLYLEEKKCIVEAKFNIHNYNLNGFFSENDLDYDENLTIRREITPSGKSRSFINDTPVNLQQMKKIGEYLVDIHSQHKTLTLNQANTQLTIVDQMAKNSKILSNYKIKYESYKILLKTINDLEEKEKQAKLDQEYFQFLFDELVESNLEEIEGQNLEEELKLLSNAESINTALNQSLYSLDEDDQSLIDQIQLISNEIQKQSSYHPDIQEISQRLESVYIELKDIVNEMGTIASNIVYDPERIELLNEKMNLVFRLQQKHQVNSIEELIEKKDIIERKLNDISSLEFEIKSKKAEAEKLYKNLNEEAKIISQNRKKAIPSITSKVLTHLKELGMPNASFIIDIENKEDIAIDGIDNITFLFSANKGSLPQPIHKIASGGELSRFMLSIKSVTAQAAHLPTIIFDEIDSGVSGDIAGKTGNILKKMGENMQVIAITHLPQIAAKGNNHLFVYKYTEKDKTFSQIKHLSDEEKTIEIAKMLSDNKITDAALQNAEALIKG